MAGIWRDKYRYKKSGVMLLELTPAARVQGGLFDAPNTAAAQARMRMIDVLNRRFGRNTVGFAAVGIQRTWNLRSDFISPRYTTSWDECCRCKTEAECAIATQTGCPIGPTLRNSARREFRCVQLLRIDRRERRQDQTEHSRRRCRLVLFCRHLGSRTLNGSLLVVPPVTRHKCARNGAATFPVIRRLGRVRLLRHRFPSAEAWCRGPRPTICASLSFMRATSSVDRRQHEERVPPSLPATADRQHGAGDIRGGGRHQPQNASSHFLRQAISL